MVDKNKWTKLKGRYKLKDDDKHIIVGNMVDYESSDGYKFLELVDKTDFVQRDALYFGTARIDISPKHLYGKNLMESELKSSFDEEKLIESNLSYLRERFYKNHEIRWFTRLYEKILASLIMSKEFEIEWLWKFDDFQFKTLITENLTPKNKSAKLPKDRIRRMEDLFKGEMKFSPIFELKIPFEKQSVVDLEYKLSKSVVKHYSLILSKKEYCWI
ncbi:MAG: hypothetical protein PQ964_01300 [Methanobacteriaceae archaeon]